MSHGSEINPSPEPIHHTMDESENHTRATIDLTGNTLLDVLEYSQSEAVQRIKENPNTFLDASHQYPNSKWISENITDLSSYGNFVVGYDFVTTTAHSMKTNEPLQDFDVRDKDIETKAILQILQAPETAFPSEEEIMLTRGLSTPPVFAIPDGTAWGETFSINNRTSITNTRQDPYYAVVRLELNWPNYPSTTVATGFLISNNTVLTNGHVLYNPSRGGWATSVTVFPGRNGNDLPYGYYSDVKEMWVGGSWHTNQHPNGDFGVIRLNSIPNVPSHFWLQARSDAQLKSLSISMTGFPLQVSPPAAMYRSTGSISSVTPYRIDTNAYGINGVSGSPIYDSAGWVVGIGRGGPVGEGDTNGVRIIQDLINWLNSI